MASPAGDVLPAPRQLDASAAKAGEVLPVLAAATSSPSPARSAGPTRRHQIVSGDRSSSHGFLGVTTPVVTDDDGEILLQNGAQRGATKVSRECREGGTPGTVDAMLTLAATNVTDSRPLLRGRGRGARRSPGDTDPGEVLPFLNVRTASFSGRRDPRPVSLSTALASPDQAADAPRTRRLGEKQRGWRNNYDWKEGNDRKSEYSPWHDSSN